jgi:hypothetical protein
MEAVDHLALSKVIHAHMHRHPLELSMTAAARRAAASRPTRYRRWHLLTAAGGGGLTRQFRCIMMKRINPHEAASRRQP